MNGEANESTFGIEDSLSGHGMRLVQHSGFRHAARIRPVSARNGEHAAGLRFTTERSGSAVIIGVSGEVDAGNVSNWAHLLHVIVRTSAAPGPIVVDVRGLEFMGLCAFVVLAGEARRCQQRGTKLHLVSRQPIVARIITECGLRRLLPVHPTIDAALHNAASAFFDQGAKAQRQQLQ